MISMMKKIDRWEQIPEEEKEYILIEARGGNTADIVKENFKKYGYSNEEEFFNDIKKRTKKVSTYAPEGELSDENLELLQRFKEGKVGYDEVQRKLAASVFEQILKNPKEVKVRDWLQSEVIKLKKDETTRQKDALEMFINSLFGGFIPSIVCPHCGKSTVIPTKKLGEIVRPEVMDAEVPED